MQLLPINCEDNPAKEALVKSFEEFWRSPFDINQLTEFNQALIYGFDTQASLIVEPHKSS